MGREAICQCDWAGITAQVKVQLESSEIVVRGEIRERIPFSELRGVSVQSDRLCFRAGGEPVQLFLGASTAEKWAAAIKTPPTLSRKLGITSKSIVRTIGGIRDEALQSALAEAAQISDKNPDLIVACVDTPKALEAALRKAREQLSQGIPIWVVYAKGPGHPLSESSVRSLLRAGGMMDTKVASVSARLTALRFNLRRNS